MKKVYFILMFLMMPKIVWADACDGVDFNPKFNLYSSYGELKYDMDKDVSYISSMANKMGLHSGILAGGLASATIAMNTSFNGYVMQRGEGDVCLVPTVIDIFIGFQNPTIYVANHYKPDSCEYYVTVRHEQAHMQINKKTLEYYLPEFKAGLEAYVKEVKPVSFSNMSQLNQVKNEVNNIYANRVKELVIRFNEILQAEQMKLDNMDNYKHEQSLCNKANATNLGNLVKQMLR